MNKTLLAIIVALIIIAGFAFNSYNKLITMDEDVMGKWAQVENQLQRRNDLIPNLVSTVKGYAAHEDEVFKSVAEARAKLAGAKTVADIDAADKEVQSSLSRLLMVAESYPQLKANEAFTQLQDELAGTENRIAVARMDYNASVQRLNARIKSLPDSLFAGPLGFQERDYFKADEGAQKVPTVQFN